MEEVVSSNLTRSTKTFQTLTVFPPARTYLPESNWSPKPILSTGSHGHRVDFDTAHDQANRFKAVAGLGTLGTVFRVRCRLPETTTFRFYIGTMPTEQQ